LAETHKTQAQFWNGAGATLSDQRRHCSFSAGQQVTPASAHPERTARFRQNYFVTAAACDGAATTRPDAAIPELLLEREDAFQSFFMLMTFQPFF
jgi:hypothetical protein